MSDSELAWAELCTKVESGVCVSYVTQADRCHCLPPYSEILVQRGAGMGAAGLGVHRAWSWLLGRLLGARCRAVLRAPWLGAVGAAAFPWGEGDVRWPRLLI